VLAGRRAPPSLLLPWFDGRRMRSDAAPLAALFHKDGCEPVGSRFLPAGTFRTYCFTASGDGGSVGSNIQVGVIPREVMRGIGLKEPVRIGSGEDGAGRVARSVPVE
jgi:hypothetical protein